MVKRLFALLKRNDFDAEECFELLTFHLDPIHSVQVDVLSDSIKNLDFDAALKHVKTLAQRIDICLGGENG